MGAEDVLPPPSAVDEAVHLRGRAVEDGDGVTVALHVQDEVLAHHGQPDQPDVVGRGRCVHGKSFGAAWCGMADHGLLEWESGDRAFRRVTTGASRATGPGSE